MKVFRDKLDNGNIVTEEIFDIIECTYSGKFMGERSITATIQWASPIDFQIGDYIDMEMQSLIKGVNNEGIIGYNEDGLNNVPERFYIYTMPTIKKTARSGTHGQGFEHTVVFYPAQHELACVQMRDMGNSIGADSVIYTGFDNVTFYGGAFELMERIMMVLKEAYHDSEGNPLWRYEISDSVNEQKNTTLERFSFNFSGNTVMDALLKLSDKEGINTTFFINNRTIYVGFRRPYFCRIADGGGLDTNLSTQIFSFKYGKTSHLSNTIDHGGLYDITKTIGKELPITKLFAYGASRNLNRYYCSDRVAGGRYVNRLMLPSFDMDGRTDYIISEDSMAKYGVREASKQFDEIYPSLRYMTYGDLRTIRYCIKIKASGLAGDSITNPSYNVARVQCYKVVEGVNGINRLEEAAPQDDLAIYVHAEGKVVKVVLYGGETNEDAIEKQLQHDKKVPTDGTNYIPGSCFLVHDNGFGGEGELNREAWFSDYESGSFTDKQKEEIKLHQINYTDTFWLTDLYVFQSYNQTYFIRDGYSAWAWPRLNNRYTTSNGYVADDSTPVNAILGVEPITIVDTNMTAANLDKQQKTFDIYLGDVGFKIDEQNDFGEMVFVVAGAVKVSILDGLLAGREFEVNGAVTDSQFSCVCAYNDDGSRNEEFFKASDYSGEDIPQRAFNNGAIWRLRLNRTNLDEPDYSNMNIAIPNAQINASAGDHLVLLDIFMPDIYIHAAENRLLREARKYLDANDNGTVNYAVTFDKVRMNQVPLYSMQMREGLNIRMIDEDLNIQTENNGRYISDHRDNPLVFSKTIERTETEWQYTDYYVSASASIVGEKLIVEVVLYNVEQWLNNPIRISQNDTFYDLGKPERAESLGWRESLGGYLYKLYYPIPTGINFNDNYLILRNHMIGGGSQSEWLSMPEAIDFTKGKYYTVRVRVKDNGCLSDGALFPIKNVHSNSYTPNLYDIQAEHKEGETYLYVTFWFYLDESFNDSIVYYPTLRFVVDGTENNVSAELISFYEQDYEDDGLLLPYADFTIDSITTKIYDSSNRTNAQPVKEISATLSEQHNATAWASLMNRVENTEKESENNKSTYQEIINTARRHYQTLLNLRNAIFDPDGTCDSTFLQTMMMQVGVDSMNYQLHRTRVGLSSNGNVQFFNCSCERHDDGLYHFVVNNADTLDHVVFTDGDHRGTWNIPSGINVALSSNSDDVFVPYFISIKCPKDGSSATWDCGTTQRRVDEDQTAWYFNWGILIPDSEGNYTLTETRGNAYMYGDNLICGKISDLAQKSYFDLTNGDFVLGQTSDGKAALSYVNGVLTIGGSDPDDPNGSFDEILRRLGIVEGVASGAKSTADAANAAAGAAQETANGAVTTATGAAEDASKALTAAEAAEANANALEYLSEALKNDTAIAGGLIATSQIQLRDKTGKYIDEQGHVYDEAGEGRTEQYKVTAGISGVANDQVLLWGGGDYNNAQASANMDNPTITTLIKKDGTAKIGASKIGRDKFEIITDKQSIFMANKSFADLRIANGSTKSDSNAEQRSKTDGGSISKEAEVLKSAEMKRAGIGRYKVFIGDIECNITANTDENGSAKAIVGNFAISVNGVIVKTLHSSMVTVQTNESNDAKNDTINIQSTEFIISNTSESIKVELLCDYSFDIVKSDNGNGADRAQFTVSLLSPISICSIEKISGFASDGFIISADGDHTFYIDNSKDTLAIIANGLPEFPATTNPNSISGLKKGQLYSLGGVLRIQQ